MMLRSTMMMICAGAAATTSVSAAPYVNIKRILPAVRMAYALEKKYGIPQNLLTAIAHVESRGQMYAINARGRGYFLKTKEEAIRLIETLKNQGVRDFNIGYMQINYSSHRKHFKNIGEMLELSHNLEYAAKLLKIYYRQTGSWEEAVRRYKSGEAESTRRYKNHVYSIWANVRIPLHLIGEADPKTLIDKKYTSKPYCMTLSPASVKETSTKFQEFMVTKSTLTFKTKAPRALSA